jgi:hypothetical protein
LSDRCRQLMRASPPENGISTRLQLS